MGLEADCTAIWKRRRVEGHALLESEEVVFKGEDRVRLKFATLTSIEVHEGRLKLVGPEGALTLELGARAEVWAEKIRKPKGRLDKLGVKPTHVVSVLGIDDAGFMSELEERAATVHRGRVREGSDLVFLGVGTLRDLVGLPSIERLMARDGGVWVVWAKGRHDLNEDHVRVAAKRSGLVDVKVVAFSPTLSALKLVIPLARR